MALMGELASTASGNTLRRILGRPPRLLLAEDDDELRWALAGALEKEQFVVEQISTSTELIDRFAGYTVRKKQSPDAIISDVRMPGNNAVDVVRWLRDAGCHMPVVFVSAFDLRLASLDALGVTRFLRKPVPVAQLVRIVELLIRAV